MDVQTRLPCRFRDIVHLRWFSARHPLPPSEPSHSWHECVYVVHGPYIVTVEDRVRRLTDGQCAVYPAGLVHRVDLNAEFRNAAENLELFILQWDAYTPPKFPTVLEHVSPRILEVMRWMRDIKLKGSGSADVMDAIVFSFLNELGRSSETGSLLQLVNDYMTWFVNRQLNPSKRDKVSVGTLADASGLSVFHFIRVFKKQSGGKTPIGYLQQYRANKAREWLTRTEMPLTEVAWRLGFASRNYLARFVADRFNVPPSVLRKGGGRIESKKRNRKDTRRNPQGGLFMIPS